jgi:uncharacterized membrane protein YbhN (UPF0104 family)
MNEPVPPESAEAVAAAPSAPRKPLSPAAKRGLLVAKLVLFGLVLFFVGRALVSRVGAISWDTIHFLPGAFLLAVLVQFVSMSMGPIVYRQLLKPMGTPPGWVPIFAISWIVRAGKYLPGKVAPAVGTVWMFRREGVSVPVATSATLLYQGLSLVIIMITAIPITLWQPVRAILPASGLWFLLLIPAALAGLHPKVFFPVANFLLGKLRMPALKASHRMRDYVAPLAVMGIGQIMAGVTLWLILQSITPVPLRVLPVCICGIALAGGAGMLALFAPAGLGVREGVLLVILDRLVDPSHAAVAVLVSRLLQSLAEILMAGIGVVMLRMTSRARAPE